jgi:hypothetical protein
VKRGRWGRKRRRLGAVALGALALAVVAQLVAPSAGAVVANPGDLKVQMRVSLITPTFRVDGVSTLGTGQATLRSNGLVNIPQSSLQFAPTAVHISVPSPPPAAGTTDTLPPIDASSTVVVTVVPTSDFYGGVDPNSGSGFVVGDVKLLWDQTGTLTGCTLGPLHIVARSNAQGATPYSPQTGKVTMVDPGFTLAALPDGAGGCGGYEAGLNAALSLPVTTTTTTTQPNTPITQPPTYPPNSAPPVPSVVVGLTFTPAPKRVPVQQPPTQPTPPTVKPPSVGPPPSYNPPPNTPSGGNNNGGSYNGGGNNGGGYNPGGGYRPPPPPGRRNHNNHPGRNHPRKPVKPPKVTKPTKPIKPRNHNPQGNGHKGGKQPLPVTRGTYLPGAHPLTNHAAPLPQPGQRRLHFQTAAFVKPSGSILRTGLDVVAFIALLVFSSLALWLVTSEVSAVTANARRLRAHRIAGVTSRRSWPK